MKISTLFQHQKPVFSFEFLGLLFLGFSGQHGFTISGVYFMSVLPQEFLMNAVFLLLVGFFGHSIGVKIKVFSEQSEENSLLPPPF